MLRALDGICWRMLRALRCAVMLKVVKEGVQCSVRCGQAVAGRQAGGVAVAGSVVKTRQCSGGAGGRRKVQVVVGEVCSGASARTIAE